MKKTAVFCVCSVCVWCVTKKQWTNWVAKAPFAAGAERGAVLALLDAVFLQGDTIPQGGKRPVFVRVYFDIQAGEMTIWLHRNITHSGMEKTIRAAGLELTSLRANKAHIAGPLDAPSGLGRGQHVARELDVTKDFRAAFRGVSATVLARLESVKCYDYGPLGVYYEVNTPCR